MSPAPGAQCAICGCDDPQLAGLGPLATARTGSFSQLQAIFSGDLDEYTCPTNHKTPGLVPTILVNLENGEHLIAWGSMTAGRDAGKKYLLSELGTVTTFDHPDQLRLALAHYAADRLQDVIAAAKQTQALDWRQLSSGYFACAALLLSTPLPGTEIKLPDGVVLEDVVQAVVNAQVRTWIGFCASWSKELEAGRTIEADFACYVDPGSILHRAVDEFLRVTANLDKWTEVGSFCVEAVRATLCAVRGIPNPHLKSWAKRLVEQEVLRFLAGEEAPPHLVAMEISAERIRDTVPYEALLNACAHVVAEAGLSALSAIQALGEKAGHANLAFQLRIVPDTTKKIAVQQVIDAVSKSGAGRSAEAVWLAVNPFLDILAEGVTPESLTAIADGLAAARGSSPEELARADQWLCSHLNQRRFIKAALDRLEASQHRGEDNLPVELRAAFAMERSNALRAAGRPADALAEAERSNAILEEAGFTPSVEAGRNLAILYEESGRQQEALDIFLDQLKTADRDHRLRLLFSIAGAYTSLGRHADSLPYLEEARELAAGPLAASRPRAIVMLAAAKSVTGGRAEALALLRDLPAADCADPVVLIPCASAWINVSQEHGLLDRDDRKRLAGIAGQLDNARKTSFEAGDMLVHIMTLRLLALLTDLAQIRNDVFWDLLDHAAREFERAPDPMALLARARDTWAAGDLRAAKAFLAEVPDAVATRYRAERDPALKVESLHSLRRFFDHIGGLAIRGRSLENVRIVAESQRDLLGRMMLHNAGGGSAAAAAVVPDDETVAALGGPTAVLEWLDTTDGIIGLATVISADGEVSASDLGDPGVDLDELSEKMAARLSNWHEGRAGDPFDLPAWVAFESWVQETLEARLPDGGHLVVLEHPEVWGLQWHVAAAPRWRTSYSPGWSALLSAHAGEDPAPPIGAAMVAKFHDSPQVVGPMEASLGQTRELARELGRPCVVRAQKECDRAALIELLESCGVVKLLCHGYVDPTDRQVALSIAVESRLPLADSAAAATPAGRRHRFGWQECQTLERAPALLFSAACSSGQAHPAGLGERLGFYRVLHRAGTRAFVAPRWDIKPAAVLPILDDAMARHLRGGAPIGEALHQACEAASAAAPRWIAWALALEGDWK
jgi:hypothetical protein